MEEEKLYDSIYLIETIVEKLKLIKKEFESIGLEEKAKDVDVCINLGSSIVDDKNFFGDVDKYWDDCQKESGSCAWIFDKKFTKKYQIWCAMFKNAENEYKKAIKTFYTYLANYSYDWWL